MERFSIGAVRSKRAPGNGKAGSRFFIRSVFGRVCIQNLASYTVTNSGLTSVVKTLVVELIRGSLGVNTLCSGYFHVELTHAAFQDPKWQDQNVSRNVIGFAGDRIEGGRKVICLYSASSRHATDRVLIFGSGGIAA
jgi:NAD(P)-dependent dehydrogenase (short-subunit alcohol dehydrogenase family)